MTLYHRGSNIWWSRIEVDKRVYQFSTRTTSKNTARSIEAAFRTDKIKGRVGLSTPTLSEFAARFVNHGLVGRVARPTFKYYVHHLAVLDRSPLGDTKLDRIDRAAVDAFIESRRRKIGITMLNHDLRTLRRILHLAHEWEVIPRVLKIKLLPGERQREFILTDGMVQQFQACGLMGKIVAFLVDTGLRRGEVCNLLWTNVSTNGREILITKGKTKAARRRIPLTDRAQAIIAALPRTGPHVFSDRYGHGVTVDWLSHSFAAARKELGISPDAVLHSTRHTFCSRLGEAGADAFAIQRLAGHSSITISQRYVHPSAARLDGAIGLLNGTASTG